jgi:hypothetical protein
MIHHNFNKLLIHPLDFLAFKLFFIDVYNLNIYFIISKKLV